VKVTARERRLMIIGAGILAVALIFYAAMSYWPSSDDAAREVDLKKRTFIKYKEIISKENDYKGQLEQSEKQLDTNLKRLLPGNSPSLATAELQRVVKELADLSGTEITNRSPQVEKKVQGYDSIVKVSVRIEMKCSPETLVQFLVALQNYDKLLLIDEFVITYYKLPSQKKVDFIPNLVVSGYIGVQEPAKTGARPEPENGQHALPGLKTASGQVKS
jgi:hypothetical protein